MRDHDDEFFLGNLLEQVHNLYAGFGIQCAGRLVRQQNLRVVDKRTGNRHTLHLTAGHLVGLFVQLVAKPHLFKHLLRTGSALRFGNAGQRECQFDVGQHGLVRNEVVALEHKTDRVVAIAVPVGVLECLGRATRHGKVARVVSIQSADDVEQSGFSAA